MTDAAQPVHPRIERLTAYQAGELAPEEAEEIRDHLAVCRECVRVLLELPRFYAMMEAEPAPAATPAETDASWQALRARLGPALAGKPASSSETAHRFRRRTLAPALVWGLAAGLAACLVGFPLWIATHRSSPSPLALSLPGADVTRGGQEPAGLLTVRRAEETAVLVLPLPDRPPFPAYRVEIRSPGGDLRLAADLTPTAVAVPPVPAGSGGPPPPRLLTVAFSSALLMPGDYRLRMIGLRGGRGEVLAEHALRVVGP